MRVRVAFGRPAMGRPAGVPDADRAGERLAREPGFEIAQLAFSTPAGKLPAFQRGDAGGVVAPILEPLEGIAKQAGNRLTPENSHHSAHLNNCHPIPPDLAPAANI